MTSTIDHLYKHIIIKYEMTLTRVQYLKDRGLLLADNSITCIKVKDSVVYIMANL